MAFNIALVRFHFFFFFGNLTFCSLLSSHLFPFCSALCPSACISMKYLNFKGFFFKALPRSERRFSFLPLSHAAVTCDRIDESQPESVVSCYKAGFYGETRCDESALAHLRSGPFPYFYYFFSLPLTAEARCAEP